MTLTDNLLIVANAFCSSTGMGRGTLSATILGKGSRLSQIDDDGADLTTKLYERSMDWFAANWPEDTPWPEGVARPDGGNSQVTKTEVAPAVAAAVSGSSPSAFAEPEVSHG